MTAEPVYTFRLYIAGGTQNSLQAVANLTAICNSYLPDRHTIELVDILRDPKRALTHGIVMTPTTVKLAPSPVCRIVGTLSHTETVLQCFGISTSPS